VQEVPQSETTSFYPRSPYAVAKLYGFWIVKNYREAYNLFASNGILFNHESERRGEIFVTRKITMAVAKIVLGLQEKLVLGNLDSKRDWGYAPEYCEGMWRILQHDTAEDFVLATGKIHTIREFCELAFQEVGITIEWQGVGVNEIGVVSAIKKGKLQIPKETRHSEFISESKSSIPNNLELNSVVVSVSPKYFRPTEVDLLIGDPSKAKEKLGWEAKTDLNELVRIMVESDFKKVLERGF